MTEGSAFSIYRVEEHTVYPLEKGGGYAPRVTYSCAQKPVKNTHESDRYSSCKNIYAHPSMYFYAG